MLNQLIDKITSWDRNTADKFNNYAFNTLYDERDYMYEITDDGIYLWRDVTALFFNNNGIVYKLTQQWNLGDIEFHQRLYERVLSHNDFRIEIPLHHTYVNINGIIHMYTEVQRPNYELGYDDFEHVFTGQVDTKYFLERVNQFTILFNHLKYLYNYNNCKLPKILPKRMNDTVGFFWNDFKECKVDIDFFKSISMTKLYRSLLAYESMYDIYIDKHLILTTAKNKWI